MDGEYLTLAQAAQAVPAVDGKRPHPATVYRWTTIGINGIRLPRVRIGRRILVNRGALQAFLEELSSPPAVVPVTMPDPISTPRPRTEKQRQADIEAARARLEARGILQG